MEDLIPEEDVVVTITRGGYAKRTKADLYRAQQRGGKGVRGAALRGDDIVEHFFVTTTHHWMLFFTNQGRVYRAKAYELPEAGRDAKGQHVANLLAFQPDEQIAQVLDIRDYDARPTWCWPPAAAWSRRPGWPTTTPTAPAASSRSTSATSDELVGAELVDADDDLLLVSRKGQSIRFRADDEAAAADGPGHLGRHRHAVPRRRRAAGRRRRAAGRVPAHRHRRRVRQAHPARGVDGQGPRHPRRASP